ncbi:MAG: flagellin [Limnochordia bacterium]
MRIQTNVSALNAWRNLNQTTGAMGKNLERLSSGFRINKAADDAAGLAISEKMRAQIRGLNQATRNAQDGISLIQTAEGAMGEIQSILQRMRELANQAASDGLTDDDRGQIQKEVDQLVEQITDIATTTQFNTKTILDGTSGMGIIIQTGANAGEELTFDIASVDPTGLGVAAISIATQTDASAAISTIDDAINDISGYRAELGALQNRLEHSITNLEGTSENLQAAESRIRDVDMAQEMTQFTRNQILMQSGTAMLAQANMMPQAVLKLLG